MPFEILDHTADLKIKVVGDDFKDLFKESINALCSILGGGNFDAGKVIRKIKIEAIDPTSLLVDFLNEVVSLSQIHKEIYCDIKIMSISDISIYAEVSGRKIKDEFKEDIKALTYHEANIVKRKDGKLETILIFDI